MSGAATVSAMHRTPHAPRTATVLTFLLAWLAIPALALAQDGAASLPDDADADAVVLRVGERERTLAQFADRFEIAIRGAAAQQGLPLTADTRPQFEALAPQFLQQRGQQLALLELADQRDIELAEGEVDALVAEVRAGAEDQEFAELLSAAGIGDEATLRTLLAESARIGQLRDRIADGIEVAEAEVQAAYDEAAASQDLPPLEQVRDQVEDSLVQQQVQARLSDLLADVQIEAFPDRLPYAAAPATPEATPQAP
jgi:hypothetical protein